MKMAGFRPEVRMKTTMDVTFSPQQRIQRSLRDLRDLFQHRVNVEGIMEPLVSVTADTDAAQLGKI